MENQEKIQDVLSGFQKSPSKDIPPVLEDYLRTVAKTGKTVFPWQQLKLLFIQKLEQVMEQFHKDDPCDHHAPFPNVENTKFNEMRQRIVDAFQQFNGAPFTVQRICELVTQPKKHYTQCDKFLRGIEKNVLVVSTVDPCGRKIVSESRALVNGLDVNGLNNQQRGDLNDITDGQRFGPLPVADWPGHSMAPVWPQPIRTENKNNSNAVNEEPSKVEEITDNMSEEKSDDNVDSGLAKSEQETESSANELVVKDSVSKDHLHKEVSSTSPSDGSQDMKEKSEIANTDNDAKQDDANSGKQTSEMRLVGEVQSDSDNQSDVSMDEKDGDRSSCEKHGMEATSAEGDGPPEKKLKTTDSRVPEPAQSEEPAVGESQVPDSTKETPHVQEQTAATEQPEQSNSVSDIQCSNVSHDSETSEESKVLPSENSEEMQQQAEDNQSEASKQNAADQDQDQLEKGLQKTEEEECESAEEQRESAEERVPASNISTEKDSESSENVKTEEDKQTDDEQSKQETDGADEQTNDSGATAEGMEIDAVPEKSQSAVNQTEAVDESEPMDQE